MAFIQLSQGKVALVDDEDAEFLNQWEWTASFESRGTKWYAIRRAKKGEPGYRSRNGRAKIRMHRVLMNPPDDLVVDHRVGICPKGHHHTGDSLDNRKCGLEVITQEENMKRVGNWRRKKSEPEAKEVEVFL